MGGERGAVVFIGSCSYSGSTILELLIGSSEGSRPLGELGRAYLPQQKHHASRECGCLEPNCDTWNGVLNRSPRDVHFRIFEKFDEGVLVDSTKDPHWIKDRSEEVVRRGSSVVNILIWKSPEEVRKSYKKRGLEKHWKRHWINYHRLYFTLVEDFFVVPYESVIDEEMGLERRMERIGLDVERRFWEKSFCSLFGNDSAKRHMHEEGSKGHETIQKRRKRDVLEEGELSFRGIIESQYSASDDDAEFDGKISQIVDFLEENDVILRDGSPSRYPEDGRLRFGPFSSKIRKVFQVLKSVIPKLRWGRG